MTYNVDILRSAQKRLDKVDDPIRRRIIDRIRALADDPRPAGCKKLSGRPAWRLRIGTYRVIYEVHDQKLLVLVFDVGHRREIYR
jgi:mRNA interferase RelE/StbE